MSTVTKEPLSASVDGAPIKVTPTSSPGETVHVGGLTSMDTCYLTLTNTHTVAVAVTVQQASTTSPDGKVVNAYSVPNDGFPYQLPPLLVTGGKAIQVYAGVADVVLVSGFVNTWSE